MNIRMMPPVAPALQTRLVNGRQYSAAPGSFLDVLDADAVVLEANGWIHVAPSGPTSGRPTGQLGLYQASPGALYYDTTLGKLIVSDGQTWRNFDGTAADA